MRMKPNRRYGFAYMGSRRDNTSAGFFGGDRFFNYGVPAIDVIQFDAKITIDAIAFRRAQRQACPEAKPVPSEEIAK